MIENLSINLNNIPQQNIVECGNFRLHVIETMQTRFIIAITILCVLLIIQLFSKAYLESKFYKREIPNCYIFLTARLEIVYMFLSLFILGYIYLF